MPVDIEALVTLSAERLQKLRARIRFLRAHTRWHITVKVGTAVFTSEEELEAKTFVFLVEHGKMPFQL